MNELNAVVLGLVCVVALLAMSTCTVRFIDIDSMNSCIKVADMQYVGGDCVPKE